MPRHLAGGRLRGDGVVRTLQLAKRLQQSRCGIDALAREFNVSTRTIRRDLEVLSVAGFPVTSEREDYGPSTMFWIPTSSCPVCHRAPR